MLDGDTVTGGNDFKASLLQLLARQREVLHQHVDAMLDEQEQTLASMFFCIDPGTAFHTSGPAVTQIIKPTPNTTSMVMPESVPDFSPDEDSHALNWHVESSGLDLPQLPRYNPHHQSAIDSGCASTSRIGRTNCARSMVSTSSLATCQNATGRAAERRRLRLLLQLPSYCSESHAISHQRLRMALKGRVALCSSLDALDEVMEEVLGKPKTLRFSKGGAGVKLTLGDVLDLLQHARYKPLSDAARDLVGALEMRTIADLVEDIAPANEVDEESQEEPAPSSEERAPSAEPTRRSKLINVWDGFVAFVVVASIISTGLSLDFNADSFTKGAFALTEVFTTVIFVADVCLKTHLHGFSTYWRGRNSTWNLLDVALTLMSVIETIVKFTGSGRGTRTGDMAHVMRLFVVFRALRLLRILRYVRSSSWPIVQDLANVVVGFFIGMPILLWVVVIIGVLMFLAGIITKATLGPIQGQDYTSVCGLGDALPFSTSGPCPLHIVYGEEFFGDVETAMFTSFRWMLDDFSTFEGKNMIAAFSRGYGWKFQGPFAIWMVVVIFGIYNAITANFVESILTGVKRGDLQRKYIRQYARPYVRKRLNKLLTRIAALLEGEDHPEKELSGKRKLSIPLEGHPEDVSSMVLDEKLFLRIMEDGTVCKLFRDLDIKMIDLMGLFETADIHNAGRITLQDLAKAIMKLRGETTKNEIVSTLLSVGALHGKVDAMLTRQNSGDRHRELAAPAVVSHGDVLIGESPCKDESGGGLIWLGAL